jgi:glycosyltransferase involved in cell wall biosynthesis
MPNRSLRIVMVSTFYPPYHLGGDAIHVYHLANELAKLGHSVHVIHSLDSYYLNRAVPPQGDYPNVDGVHVHTLTTGIGKLAPLMCGFGGFDWPLVSMAREIIGRLAPDVVHYHNIAGFGPGLLDKRLASRVLYTAHDYWLICERNNLFMPGKKECMGAHKIKCSWCSARWRRPAQIWRLIRRPRLDSVDVVIAPSEYVRKKLKEKYANTQMVTMYNFALEPPPMVEHIARRQHFLYVGLLAKHKGINNLVEAFVQDEALIAYKLVVVGSGPEEENLRAVIEKSHCNNVIMTGEVRNREQLFMLYRDAQALIIPSTWPENNPLVALEAASVGTPLIVTPVGGLPEIATFYKNVYVLGGCSVKDIRSGIRIWMETKDGGLEPMSSKKFRQAYIDELVSYMTATKMQNT